MTVLTRLSPSAVTLPHQPGSIGVTRRGQPLLGNGLCGDQIPTGADTRKLGSEPVQEMPYPAQPLDGTGNAVSVCWPQQRSGPGVRTVARGPPTAD